MAMRMLTGIRSVARLERRRPAAWIAACCAAAGGVSADPFVAAALGGLAGVASMGDTAAWLPTSTRRLACVMRTMIPFAACLAVGGLTAGWIAVGTSISWGCLGILVAAMTMVAVKSGTTTTADAATVAIVCGACGLALARSLELSGGAAAVVIAAVWLGVAACACLWERRHEWPAVCSAVGPSLPRTTGLAIERGPLPASGPARRLAGLAAMISTLAAMAGGLLLSPEHAANAMQVTLAWFVALAVPSALLQDGAAMRAAWDGVFRSAAAQALSRWGPPFSSTRVAVRVACGHAAVLAWPAIVACVVGLASPGGVRPAVMTLAAVGAAAAALIAVAAVCGWGRLGGETAFAIAIALVAASLWAASGLAGAARQGPTPADFCIQTPKADVEQFAASCQTRQISGPPAAINTGEFPCTDSF